MAMNLKGCINDLLIEGTIDDISASWIASVASMVGGAVGDGIREMSLAIIRELLTRGLMEIGDIEGIGYDPNLPTHYQRVEFRPWKLPIEEAMARVKREWGPSVRYPEPGAVCWLVNSAKGNEIGRRLIEEQDRRARALTMKIANLDRGSQAIIQRCLEAILSKEFIDDDNEFATRIGLSRERVKELLARWPKLQDDYHVLEDHVAINNVLNEFARGLSITPGIWHKWFTFTRANVKDVLDQWRLQNGGCPRDC